MLKYPCLVLDHDDTVVQSEATVNYPYFCYILDQFRPGATITLEAYMQGCYDPGFQEMCRRDYGFTEEELTKEYLGWKAHVRTHIPAPFPGIEAIIKRQKAEGGLLCVVSHSSKENILRDYSAHFGILPDAVYGWDLPEDQRKPSPYPLLDIMEKYNLQPHQLLVVDDMKPACQMSKAAGVEVAFAGWGRKNSPYICADMEKNSNYCFYTPEELAQFLFE